MPTGAEILAAAQQQQGGVVRGVAPAAPVSGPEVGAGEQPHTPAPPVTHNDPLSNHPNLADAQKIPMNPSLAALIKNQEAHRNAGKGMSKVYHNQHPGSTFYTKDGTRWEFDYKGELETDNLELQRELDAIADKPGSPVFVKGSSMTKAPGDEAPKEDIESRAAETMKQLRNQQASVIK